MVIFKAEDARLLAKSNSKSNLILEKIQERIKRAASRGEYLLFVEDLGFSKPNLFLSIEELDVIRRLQDAGYTVNHTEYNKIHYLKIKWNK